jgi:mono/diheme cytochrome c family protein
MLGRSLVIAVASASFAAGVGLAGGQRHAATPQKPAAQKPAASSGWQVPPDAESKKSPLVVDAKVLAMGKAVFKDKCVKCHGPAGLGDGPDADPDHQEHMNLTNPKHADANADGVVFYKVLKGRRRPKMPAFEAELNEQQIWSVVAYVQGLRKK